ncbi:MAG: transposase zinc-binding domain-containing protein, partial [Proteobacteria bacterium]|nr:transposase zinc-binding domain-containing protein [Pseudomonadota bacterium]
MNASVRPGFADVVDQFAEPIREHLSPQGHQVLNQIQACRTAALGGQVLRCEQCHQHRLQYHSCRNRHCPQCGYQASQRWVADRMQDVLPVTYHHVVFTLPHELN